MTKGYAKKFEMSPLQKNGKFDIMVWTTQTSQEKNVAFDCSAEFEGRSINQELPFGPNLTNQIVCVLTHFRQRPIAFMADVESMYSHIIVPDNQHVFLELWWCSDGNLL